MHQMWKLLDTRLKDEIQLHADLRKASGTIDMLIHAAVTARESANDSTDLQFVDPVAEHSTGILLMPKARG